MIISLWLLYQFACNHREQLRWLCYDLCAMGSSLSCIKCRKQRPPGASRSKREAPSGSGETGIELNHGLPASTAGGSRDVNPVSSEPTRTTSVLNSNPASLQETRSPAQTQIFVVSRVGGDNGPGVNGSARSRPTVPGSRDGHGHGHHATNQTQHMKGCIVDIKDLILHTSKHIRTLVDKYVKPCDKL